MGRRAALVDRDGTINIEEPGTYVLDPGQLRLVPGAADGLERLRSSGLAVVVVSNQAPIARGWMDLERLDAINETLAGMLTPYGVEIEAFYSCPHDVGDGCRCRKPEPGLLLAAADDLDLDLSASFVIGDKGSDIEAGRRVGATTILVRTGNGPEALARGATADHVADDLDAAGTLVAGLVRED